MTDPLAFPMTLHDWLPWALLILLSIAGGFINSYGRWRRGKRVISLIELIADLVMSAMGCILTASFCLAMGLNVYWTFGLSGIGAHLGPRAIFVIEWIGLLRMGFRREDVETIIDLPTGFPRTQKVPPESGAGPGAGPGASE